MNYFHTVLNQCHKNYVEIFRILIFVYLGNITSKEYLFRTHSLFLSLENLGLLTEKLKSKWLLEMIFYVVIY